MAQLISKDALVAEIERRIKVSQDYAKCNLTENTRIGNHAQQLELNDILSFINTLEVKESKTTVMPKHSYFEHIYHCGSEPRWNIGDVLAEYEFYNDYEGEYIYGEITGIKMDEENEDWLYTFKNGDIVSENILISEEAYKKN